MQQTSEAYKRIINGLYSSRTKVKIDGTDYTKTDLREVHVHRSAFEGNNPSIGNCISAEIDVTFNEPVSAIPRMAEIKPYSMIYNDEEESEWIPKGVFFSDTRSVDEKNKTLFIHGYDSMLKAGKHYPASTMAWPAKDAAVIREIAEDMGVQIDERTWDIIPTSGNYNIPLPAQYTEREVLGFIAGMYGGNFIINDYGKLHLISLNGLPEETDILINESGNYITFGGTRILLRGRSNGG